MVEPGTLYIVSTPIGNLEDITVRAVETLRSVSRILAEDTRHSRVLLDRYEVRGPVDAYHEHNEAAMTPRVLARLAAGESIALVSDAGTPLLSDPGARLVAAAAASGVRVVPVPGASALLAALVASGIAADRFTFYGFPPRKGKEREALLEELSGLSHTAVLYEAPSRVADTLAALAARGDPARRAVVARELTKQFEELRRGTLGDLAAYYTDSAPRGEVVIILAGTVRPAPSEAMLRERARALRAEGLSTRDVAATLARESGAPRNVAYRLASEVAAS
jgi:16S rRNA (cytidine1402-2'-O)-methyltransferase